MEPGRFLIWAVTGAGKTEMIFPFIDYELHRGRKVLIATPRRDVVLELQPRLKRAFPDRSVVTLYGGSEERWDQGEITLSTTHQLLRFYRSFDLVIIDEIDAFPYHNNPMLQAAAQRVCTSDGAYVLLSATPPAGFIRDAERGRLEHVKVPVRFHRHPLPVPRILKIKVMSGWKGRVPSNLKTALQRSIDRGAQLFVFVPKIREVEPTVEVLRRQFPGCSVEGTSSQDPHRADKVTNFRQGNIRLLVTTTILERGVTVPRTDVFILEADSGTFDSAALVQMAGRAGRSKDDPNGRVFFAAAAHTQSQARAIRQIRQMNRLAKRKGYLLEHP
jgi:competence protein ComFA